MIRISSHKILAGDFHTHWYWDKQNPTVMLAAMNHLGLDFVVLQAGKEQVMEFSKTARLEVSREEDRRLTIYRLAMPWTSLAPLVPRRGMQFKLAVLVNDNDGDVRERKCLLFYGGNIGETKDTSHAHAVTLI